MKTTVVKIVENIWYVTAFYEKYFKIFFERGDCLKKYQWKITILIEEHKI